MENIDRFVGAVEAFREAHLSDEKGCFRTWEHYFRCFREARDDETPDYDYLSLQLAFYLTSWGYVSRFFLPVAERLYSAYSGSKNHT